MTITVTTPPAVEPISLKEMMDYLRLDAPTEASTLLSLISAARAEVETRTGRALAAQTLTLTLDKFPRSLILPLPRPMLDSVTSVKYYDADGELQTLSSESYVVDNSGAPGAIYAPNGWPVTQARPGAVQIEYVTKGECPDPLKVVIQYLVSLWFHRREPVEVATVVAKIPLTVEALIQSHRIIYRLPE